MAGNVSSFQIADITFNVWYRLSEELIKSKDEKLHELFRPYIQRLIGQLCVHCQLDEDTSKVSPSISILQALVSH